MHLCTLDPRSWPFPRLLRIAAWTGVMLAASYLTAQVAARWACRDGVLRGRILTALQARLGPVELGPDVRVDPLFRVRFGPLAIPGARRGDAPLVRVETIRVGPDLRTLVSTGRVVPASVKLEGVRVEIPDRPGAARELSQRFARRPAGAAGSAAGGAASSPTLRVRDLVVAFTAGGHRLTAGPWQLVVRQGVEDGPALRAELRLPRAGRGTVELRRDGQAWQARATLDGVGREALPEGIPASLSAAWGGGTLSASLEGALEPALARAHGRVSLEGRDLALAGPLAGAEAIGPVDLGFTGELSWNGQARRARLDGGRLVLPGGAPVGIEGDLGLGEGLPVALRVRAEKVDFLRTAAALPEALSLPADAPHPAGTLDARLDLAGPLLDPGAWQLYAELDLDRMREAARGAPPVAPRAPFLQRVEPAEGPVREFLVGPQNPDFVPIAELPRWVIRAVTASEDAGFFGHAGFDFEELRNAAVQGAQAGRVVRGGSTITQQLAKNLYLSRERTLARKLREALVTVALEATVPKQRLMEIYLNVAEWGPGVWGIGPAARHWFGKDARDLSPREAAFLATVIPNPVRYHYMWDRGWLSDAWAQRVDGLLRTMNGQGTLSGEELAGALEQPLTFGRGAADGARPEAGGGATTLDPADDPGRQGRKAWGTDRRRAGSTDRP